MSPSDVSDEQIQKVARITVAMQIRGKELQKRYQQKYGNPQEMDSTQLAKVQKQFRREQMQIFQKVIKQEQMNMMTFQQIRQAASQDSTLQKRLRAATMKEMKKRQSQMNPQQNQ